jgi:hypothetical protein
MVAWDDVILAVVALGLAAIYIFRTARGLRKLRAAGFPSDSVDGLAVHLTAVLVACSILAGGATYYDKQVGIPGMLMTIVYGSVVLILLAQEEVLGLISTEREVSSEPPMQGGTQRDEAALHR